MADSRICLCSQSCKILRQNKAETISFCPTMSGLNWRGPDGWIRLGWLDCGRRSGALVLSASWTPPLLSMWHLLKRGYNVQNGFFTPVDTMLGLLPRSLILHCCSTPLYLFNPTTLL